MRACLRVSVCAYVYVCSRARVYVCVKIKLYIYDTHMYTKFWNQIMFAKVLKKKYISITLICMCAHILFLLCNNIA